MVVVHVPHAATAIPMDVREELLLTDDALATEVLRMTDAWTDLLFGVPPSVGTVVRFPVSRLVVDPERFAADAAEPMAKIGMGVVYERTSRGATLRRPPDAATRDALLQRFYAPHHAALTAAVERSLAAWGRCLIVDGHSFPARALPYELDPSAPREAFCLGTDPFHTPYDLLSVAKTYLEARGHGVTVNRPFAGALVPAVHYGKDRLVHALMVEVNRGLYMDEATGSMLPRFGEVQAVVRGLVERLAAFMRSSGAS